MAGDDERAGESIWSHTYGGDSSDNAGCVIETSDGSYLLAGETRSLGAGYYDMWLVKTNAQGDSLDSWPYGGTGYEWASSVIQIGEVEYLLAGGTTSFGAGGYDAWLVCVEGDTIDPVAPAPLPLHPSSFILHPCAPNPFNPTTTISYELRAASFVNLKIYDLTGCEVAVLVNGWRQSGLHEITFDGKNLPSGSYFTRLQAGDFTQTQKMILLK